MNSEMNYYIVINNIDGHHISDKAISYLTNYRYRPLIPGTGSTRLIENLSNLPGQSLQVKRLLDKPVATLANQGCRPAVRAVS